MMVSNETSASFMHERKRKRRRGRKQKACTVPVDEFTEVPPLPCWVRANIRIAAHCSGRVECTTLFWTESFSQSIQAVAKLLGQQLGYLKGCFFLVTADPPSGCLAMLVTPSSRVECALRNRNVCANARAAQAHKTGYQCMDCWRTESNRGSRWLWGTACIGEKASLLKRALEFGKVHTVDYIRSAAYAHLEREGSGQLKAPRRKQEAGQYNMQTQMPGLRLMRPKVL